MLPGARRPVLALSLLLAVTACRPGSGPGPSGPTSAPPAPTAGGGGAGPTAPEPKTFGLLVMGDFGTGDAAEAALARRLAAWTERHPVHGLVTVGDNVYPDGHPDRFGAAWNQPFGWVERAGLPVYASLGNHDVLTDGGGPVMDLLDMPARWFRRRVGPVHLFVLDGNRPWDERQRAWLRKRLAASSVPWQFVVLHQPPYSCGLHGSVASVRDAWEGLFRRHGADLVLAGHDHDYQRFRPIGGVTHVVTGGGAAPLYAVGDCPGGTPEPAAWEDGVHQFLYLTVTRERIRGRAVPVRGPPFDRFTLRAEDG